MTTMEKTTEVEQLVCEVCLKEVPASDSTGPEVTDYVAHFCGLECYEIWKNQNEKPDVQSAD